MADFPTNVASDGSLYIQTNNVATTLNGGVSAGAASMTLASSAAFPPVGYVTVETEAVKYTSNNTATAVLSGLTRGADSTTAALHADGTAVYHNIVANHHNALKDEVKAIEQNISDRIGLHATMFSTKSTLDQQNDTNTETTFRITNAGSGASGGAGLILSTEDGGYDPRVRYLLGAGGADWCHGIDNSAADSWKLAADGSELGTNTVLTALTTGEITKPLQPCFHARINGAQNNVTGNGTVYTLQFADEIYDKNGDFNAVSTFTAPVTGKYMFQGCCRMRSLTTTSISATLRLLTSNRTYNVSNNVSSGISGSTDNTMMEGTWLADMDAGDTASLQIVVSGIGSDVVDFSATDGDENQFSGTLLN